MPELPEVETTKTSLSPLIDARVNKVKVFQPKLRWPIPNDLTSLKGYTLNQVNRRAKYLILEFNRPLNTDSRDTSSVCVHSTPSNFETKSIIIHLGMSGSLQQFPVGTKKRKHDHVILNFTLHNSNKHHIQLHYHDPRRFGAILWFDDYANKLFNHLGAEPLGPLFNGDYLYNRIHRIQENMQRHKENKQLLKPITRPIKAVIMDQVNVVGVGNIYATESLFLAKIHPNMPAHKLSLEQLNTLATHIHHILERAIVKGGTTLRDFTVSSGTTGYFQQTLEVYGKHNQPCPTCGTSIEKTIITGRASTFCPTCQPLK